MTRRFISLFVVVLLIIKDVTGVITNGPSNAVAEAGGQAIFNCTSGTTFQNWIFAKSRDDLGTSFAQDIAINCVIQPGFETYYEVDRPGGSNNICNLIVKATTMQHAGIYTCTDSVYGPSAILTVIDSSSAMAINNTSDTIEKETVVFTCSINYNGSLSPAPTLRPHYYWKDVNGQNVSDFIEKLTENEIVSEISVTAGRQDIASYTCRLYLKLDPPVNDGYASNTPTVNNSASSPPIVVLSTDSSTDAGENCLVYVPETSNTSSDKIAAIILGVLFGLAFIGDVILLLHCVLRKTPVKSGVESNVGNGETTETQKPYENVAVSAYAELVPVANNELASAAYYEKLSPTLSAEMMVCNDEG